eukprot:7280006-Prymnesium_polylepis.1
MLRRGPLSACNTSSPRCHRQALKPVKFEEAQKPRGRPCELNMARSLFEAEGVSSDLGPCSLGLYRKK